MIKATRTEVSHKAGPSGGIKSVMIELREGDAKPFLEQLVSIAAGDAASELEQVTRAVPKLMAQAKRSGQPWHWG